MMITSSQNEKIKNLRVLFKEKKAREEQNVFLAEGVNLVKDIPATYFVRDLFVKASKYDELSSLEDKFNLEAWVVDDRIFDALGDTVAPSGVIAVVEKPPVVTKVEGDTVFLLDGITDPGNLGTIIRTAAAKGIGYVVCMDCTDAYSPKCVRAAMSGTFFVRIAECNEEEALRLVEGYDIAALDMGGTDIYDYRRGKKLALTVGSEAHGVRKSVRNKAKDILAIPMNGKIESLNAAISIGIAAYVIR